MNRKAHCKKENTYGQEIVKYEGWSGNKFLRGNNQHTHTEEKKREIHKENARERFQQADSKRVSERMRSTKRKEERKRGRKTEARQRLTALTRSITFKHSHKSRRVWVLIVFKLPGHSGSYHWPFHSISVRNKMCSSTTLPPPLPPLLLLSHPSSSPNT